MAKLLNALASVAFCILSVPASAQNLPATPISTPAPHSDPLASYRAYDAAVTRGDLREAAQYATEAWQLAEQKWGARNANTPGLAYNAAWSAALIGKSAERIDAAQRAVELASRGPTSYSLADAQFLLAYAQYFATPAQDRPAQAMKLANAALPIEATWNDFLVVNALVTTANVGASANRGRTTVAIAERALVAIDRLTPTDTERRVMALFARAQGRLVAGFDQKEAVADLIQARVTYGAMRYTDDASWGALAAWEMAARSVVLSIDGYSQTRTGTRIVSPRTRRALSMTEEQERIIYGTSRVTPEDTVKCEAVKRRQRAGADIQYPLGEINNARVAGVILRHDIAGDGRVTNARLLGVVPAGRFGENALSAVRTWRYDVPLNTPALCLIDRNVGVSFAVG